MNHLELLLKDKEAVIFDVDGTLIDSMGVWKEVDIRYLARYGKEMPENMQKDLAGLSIMQAAYYFRTVIGIDETPEKMVADWNELAYEQYRYIVEPKKDAMKWLQTIYNRGLKMGVCTSNTKKLAHTVLEAKNMKPFFGVILTGEDVVKGKPDPFIYLEAAKRLNVDPKKCLVFEDIPEGICAGLSAGMEVCAIWDAFSEYQTEKKKELAHYYIHSFNDIFENRVEVLK